jgi:hypothetical protein
MDHLLTQALRQKQPDQIWLEKYISWIENCLSPESGIREAHHILPSKMFPEYRRFSLFPQNRKWFTPRDHLIAHYYLFRMWPEEWSVSLAIYHMINRSKTKIDILSTSIDDSRVQEIANNYHEIRTIAIQKITEMKRTKEAREKVSKESKERWKDPSTREKIRKGIKKWWEAHPHERSPEHCKAISVAKKGKSQPRSQREKTSRALKGRKRSPEHQEKLAASLRGRVFPRAANGRIIGPPQT